MNNFLFSDEWSVCLRRPLISNFHYTRRAHIYKQNAETYSPKSISLFCSIKIVCTLWKTMQLHTVITLHFYFILVMYVLYQMHNTTVWSIFSFWGFFGGLFTLQVIREQIWKCGYSFYWKEQLSKYLTNWLHFQVITVVLLWNSIILILVSILSILHFKLDNCQ